MKNHSLIHPFNQTWSVITSLKSVIALSAISTMFLLGCGGGTSDTTPSSNSLPLTGQAPSPSSTTWLVMGSSTAAGANVSESERWSNLLQKKMLNRGIIIKNIAKRGAVTYHALSTTVAPITGRPNPDPSANLDYAIKLKPTVIFVAFPTNDTVAGYSVDEIVKNFTSISEGARTAGIKVIILSTQPRRLSDIQRDELRQTNDQLAILGGACFVNVHTALSGTDGSLAAVYDSGDGIHPNSLGHLVILEKITSLINTKVCIQI